jgi:hypothetical protein
MMADRGSVVREAQESAKRLPRRCVPGLSSPGWNILGELEERREKRRENR